jgi:hypothetical protein
MLSCFFGKLAKEFRDFIGWACVIAISSLTIS